MKRCIATSGQPSIFLGVCVCLMERAVPFLEVESRCLSSFKTKWMTQYTLHRHGVAAAHRICTTQLLNFPMPTDPCKGRGRIGAPLTTGYQSCVGGTTISSVWASIVCPLNERPQSPTAYTTKGVQLITFHREYQLESLTLRAPNSPILADFVYRLQGPK